MPATDIKPEVRPPVRIVVDAVNEAHALGVPISADTEYVGVVLTSTLVPGWERDPRAGAVSPLGAVLLIEQPAIADLDKALERALGTHRAWHLGFEHGIAGREVSRVLNDSPRVQLAGEGHMAGVQLRTLLHRRQAVPIERSAEERTQTRLVPARPTAELEREALRRLMAHAKTSDVLELAADICRDRANADGGGIVGDKAVNNAVTEAELRGIARDLRGDDL